MASIEYEVFVAHSNENGRVIRERWRVDGKLCRYGGLPAVLYIDEFTGVVTLEEYYRNGQLHRNDGPAQIKRDAQTGEVLEQRNFMSGLEVSKAPRATPKEP